MPLQRMFAIMQNIHKTSVSCQFKTLVWKECLLTADISAQHLGQANTNFCITFSDNRMGQTNTNFCITFSQQNGKLFQLQHTMYILKSDSSY